MKSPPRTLIASLLLMYPVERHCCTNSRLWTMMYCWNQLNENCRFGALDGLFESEVFCAWKWSMRSVTAWRSVEDAQTEGQSSVSWPVAPAPICSRIYSAGFAPSGHGGAP